MDPQAPPDVPTRPTALSEHTFPRAIAQLWLQRATGTLSVGVRHLKKSILFQKGTPVFAESNVVEESLGAFLVKRGELEQTVVFEALNQAVAGGRDISDVLVQKQVLAPNALFTAMQRCFGACILDVFRWPEGELSFDNNAPDTQNKVCIKVSPVTLVLRGVCAFSPINLITADFGQNLNAPVQLRPGALDDTSGLNLKTVERKMAEILMAPHTFSELAGAADVTDELALRFVYALSVLDMVADPHVVARDRAAAAPAPVVVEDGQAEPLTTKEKRIIDEAYVACKGQDHFQWLGLAREASFDQLRSAFLDKCLELSPAAYKGRRLGERAERLDEIFIALVRAFSTLAERSSRAAYIKQLERRAERAASAPGPDPGRFAIETDLVEAKTMLDNGLKLLEDSPKKALAYLESAVELEPQNAAALAHLGLCTYLADNSKMKKAVQFLQQSMAVEPDWAEPYMMLGRVYEIAGDFGSAKLAFSEALRRDADHPEAKVALGRVRT